MINPNYEVAESDYTNNIMKCRSRYDGQRIWTYNCHTGEATISCGILKNMFDNKPSILNKMFETDIFNLSLCTQCRLVATVRKAKEFYYYSVTVSL